MFPRSRRRIVNLEPDSEAVRAWGSELVDDINRVLQFEPDTAWPISPHVVFSLELTDIEEVKPLAKTPPEDVNLIIDRLVVQSEHRFPGLVGWQRVEKGTRFSEIVTNWNADPRQQDEVEWISDLAHQIKAAATNKLVNPSARAIVSTETGRAHIPILVYASRRPRHQRMEFEVHFPLLPMAER